MSPFVPLLLASAPTIVGSLGSTFPIPSAVRIGDANESGCVVVCNNATISLSAEMKEEFRIREVPFDETAIRVRDGFVLGNTRWMRGKHHRFPAGFFTLGASNNRIVGFSVDKGLGYTPGVGRAAILRGSNVQFVSFRPNTPYDPPLDQYASFSRAYDVDNQGNIVVVSLPRSIDRAVLPSLRPYVISNGTPRTLLTPVSISDVYPLKFAFDGSIIGSAYNEPTIEKTNWAGAGLSTVNSPAYMRWQQKGGSWRPSIGWSGEDRWLLKAIDASGDFVIGLTYNERSRRDEPTLWWRDQIARLSLPKGVKLKTFLGFLRARAAVCEGSVKGKASVFVLKLQTK